MSKKSYYYIASVEHLERIKSKLDLKEDKQVISQLIEIVSAWANKTGCIAEISPELYKKLHKKIINKSL